MGSIPLTHIRTEWDCFRFYLTHFDQTVSDMDADPLCPERSFRFRPVQAEEQPGNNAPTTAVPEYSGTAPERPFGCPESRPDSSSMQADAIGRNTPFSLSGLGPFGGHGLKFAAASCAACGPADRHAPWLRAC